jgi:hypothetical protein
VGAGDNGLLSNVVDIPSRKFMGLSAKSPNNRFTIAWADGGPDQSRVGRYLLLDQGRVVAEGKLARPNDGKVANNGVFILNDWGSIETLSGTFRAYRPDGRPILKRRFKANLYNNGLSQDGRLAVCQTANSSDENDSARLTIFDLDKGVELACFAPPSGWASGYSFPADGQTIELHYPRGGQYAYGLNGDFIDRQKWIDDGLRAGDIYLIESLFAESGRKPTEEMTHRLLEAIKFGLTAKQNADRKTQARLMRVAGECFDSQGAATLALTWYDRALALDPKIGVKRRAIALRKAAENKKAIYDGVQPQ